jgi:DNA repair protein RadC
MRLREMAHSERPQERLEKQGAGALSDTELLAMLLRSGSKKLDVLGLAQLMINKAGSLYNLLSWKKEDYMLIPGIGPVKALQLITVIEIARRIISTSQNEDICFDSPEKVHAFMYPIAAGLEIEKFWVLCLNRKNRLIKHIEISSGTANNSLAHPREVFKDAIRCSASAIIAVHNHPSGDPMPSSADIKITQQLKDASKIIGIDLLDHVIIGQKKDTQKNAFYSFGESGLI